MTNEPTHDHVRHNRKFWDYDADEYQAAHGDYLDAAPARVGRVPPAGVGAAGARRRARARTCSSSDAAAGSGRSRSTRSARARWASTCRARSSGTPGKASASLPLLAADAEQLPFADAAFDVVFCDHGAMSFCDPQRTLPEVSRVLRAGGLLAFCTATPLLYLTWNIEKAKQSRRLHRTYDELGLIDFDDGTFDWVLPPGEWIRLLRAHGFEIEDLIELRPATDAPTTYDVRAGRVGAPLARGVDLEGAPAR